MNSNGNRTLFLADLSRGKQELLASWSVEITAVPAPTTWALIIFAIMFGTGAVIRRWRTRLKP